MIDTTGIITDAQLISAFESGPVKATEVPPLAMARSLRFVAEFAIAAYLALELHSVQETLESIEDKVEKVLTQLSVS